ncbi:MAG: SpoIIE family protein phosphatase [Planctomycetota bacterium]
MRLALISGGAAGAVLLVVGVLLVNNVGAWVAKDHSGKVTLGYVLSFVMAAVGGVVVGTVLYFQAAALAMRLKELAMSVAKLGHGTEVRVRVSGNDEITDLGRTVHHLASDVASLGEVPDDDTTLSLAFDPQLRELRDKTMPQGLSSVDGLELDAALSPGSRGGLDYFDEVVQDGRVVLFLLSAEGKGATAVIAVRMARDELLQTLQTGANARKALAHTNRVLHQNLPRGACAVATVLEVEGNQAKILQCGARVPVLLCARGEVEQLEAEGIALGLDEGPVFEKGLRSRKLDLASGMRLVLLNDAGVHQPDIVDLVREHSPMHTAPFMNMVLGGIEEEAGEEGLREDVVLMTAKKS